MIPCPEYDLPAPESLAERIRTWAITRDLTAGQIARAIEHAWDLHSRGHHCDSCFASATRLLRVWSEYPSMGFQQTVRVAGRLLE